MSVRPFPERRDEPGKKVLLIPVILLLAGAFLMWVHPDTRFIGAVLALTGVMTVFLVGMVYADLWVAHRRTKKMIEERRASFQEDEEEMEDYDPFVDELEDEDNQKLD
ncbi:hypothetical protein EU520_01225 [Candidatus Thorarchaeota archaeon]|nr:MAG: hypothetical protein EU520_01225 [Candidatus Thorarchaeota archaeon]